MHVQEIVHVESRDQIRMRREVNRRRVLERFGRSERVFVRGRFGVA